MTGQILLPACTSNDWEPERKILYSLREQFRNHDNPVRQLPDMLGVVTNPFLLQIVVEAYVLSSEPRHNKGELFGHFVTLLFTEHFYSVRLAG